MPEMQSSVSNHGNNLYPQTLELQFRDVQMQLDVPAGVWNPTPHGLHLADTIFDLNFENEEVLELGSGCGIHTVLIAKGNPKKITVTEITQEILDNTRHNLTKNNVNLPVDYIVADWTRLPEKQYDVMITNPPFAKSGKRYYRYFIDTFINDAHKLVRPGGRLIFIHSSMANVERSIGLMEDWGMEVRVVAETQGPFRDYYFEDKIFMQNIEKFDGAYQMIDGKHHETLTVFEAKMPS